MSLRRSKLCHILLLGNRHNVVTLHEGADLVGYFLEHLFSQVTTSHSTIELDELDDIARDSLSHRVSEWTIISIEFLHLAEVFSADTDDDDGAGPFSELVDEIFGGRHVVNYTICHQEKHLVLRLTLLRAHHVEELAEERCEECWAT